MLFADATNKIQSKRHSKRGRDPHCSVTSDVKREIHHVDDFKCEIYIHL